MDEIKEWQAQNYKMKVCGYLMLCEVSFSYSEEDGLIFTAPEFFVEKMKRSLNISYGCTNWKTHARLTPETKMRLTPENFLD